MGLFQKSLWGGSVSDTIHFVEPETLRVDVIACQDQVDEQEWRQDDNVSPAVKYPLQNGNRCALTQVVMHDMRIQNRWSRVLTIRILEWLEKAETVKEEPAEDK